MMQGLTRHACRTPGPRSGGSAPHEARENDGAAERYGGAHAKGGLPTAIAPHAVVTHTWLRSMSSFGCGSRYNCPDSTTPGARARGAARA
jgi:hypothetical protein